MTGWRVGYIAACKEIADACDKMQSQITSGTCSIAQKAAVAALKGGRRVGRRNGCCLLTSPRFSIGLDERDIPGIKTYVPQGAFYIFPEMSSFYGKTTPDGKVINNSFDLSMYHFKRCLCGGGKWRCFWCR